MVVAVVLVGLVMQSPAPCSALGPPAGMIRVHHYTDEAGYLGITLCGQINPSTGFKNGHACYGDGVYVTELNVSTPSYEILSNNYKLDGGIDDERNKNNTNKADYVFIFDVDQSSVKFIGNAKGVSILIFGGGDAVPVENAIYSGKTDDVFERIKGVQKTMQKGGVSALERECGIAYDMTRKLIDFEAMCKKAGIGAGVPTALWLRSDHFDNSTNGTIIFFCFLVSLVASACLCLVSSVLKCRDP